MTTIVLVDSLVDTAVVGRFFSLHGCDSAFLDGFRRGKVHIVLRPEGERHHTCDNGKIDPFFHIRSRFNSFHSFTMQK